MRSEDLFSYLYKTLRPFFYLIAGQLIASIVWAIDQSVRPYLLKIILDKISENNPLEVHWSIILYSSCYIIMMLFVESTARLYDWFNIRLVPNLKKHITSTLMEHMMGYSHQQIQSHFSGNLASKINDVTVGIPAIINTFIDKFLAYAFALLIAMYTVWTVDYKFALAMTIWVGIYLTVSLGLANRLKELSHERAELRSKVSGHIVDILSNMLSVRLFASSKTEKKYLDNSLTEVVHAEQKRNWFFLKLYAFQGGSFAIFQTVCLWFLISGIYSGRTTAGDFALIISVNVSIIDCLWLISKDFTLFKEHIDNVSQAIKIITSPHSISDKSDATELVVTKGEITFENVSFQHSNGDLFFDGLSLKIESGQKVGLVGLSGSGKSTFASLILRMYDCDSGCITIDGQDIRDVTQESLRKAITTVSPDTTLLNRTLLENIRYGKIEATDEEVYSAAKKAKAHDFILELSEQYDSIVGERGVKLSGGQRQRISLARAMLKNSPILILDEATNHLDSLTEKQIYHYLRKMMQEKTTIVIAHRLSTLIHMDRILVFDKGKIVEDGTHEELLTKNGLYKTLWEGQVVNLLPDLPLLPEITHNDIGVSSFRH